MKVVATIEARVNSSRLPRKVLCPILGKPVLQLLIERLARARTIDEIVVATTTSPGDDAIEALARHMNVGCFRGSEEDVLDRVLKAARAVRAETIVEITGDCPLVDPDVVDRVAGVYLAAKCDYASNTLRRTFPRGFDTQVFATRILEEVSRLTRDLVDREHVSLYIYEHPERFALRNVESEFGSKYSDVRLALDTPEDLALITRIFEALYPRNPAFTMHDVLGLLDRQPELLEINQHIQQKAVR